MYFVITFIKMQVTPLFFSWLGVGQYMLYVMVLIGFRDIIIFTDSQLLLQARS